MRFRQAFMIESYPPGYGSREQCMDYLPWGRNLWTGSRGPELDSKVLQLKLYSCKIFRKVRKVLQLKLYSCKIFESSSVIM